MTRLLEDGTARLLEDGTARLLEDGSTDGGGVTRVGIPPTRTSVDHVRISAQTLEALEHEVFCSANPTASAPEYALTAGKTIADDATWVAGAWASAYGDDGWVWARTPTFGRGEASLPIAAGTSKWLWIKASASPEDAIWMIGMVSAT